MAKTTVTPLELAEKYLIKIGVDKLIVQRSLLPALFEESILCKKLSKSDIVASNKKNLRSQETHIFINQSFTKAFFTSTQLGIYNATPDSAHNQLSDQTIDLFESNIYESLQRRNKRLSSTVISKSAIKTYTAKSDTILTTTTTKWFNQHNSETQLHIGQDGRDGDEFKDFRLGILIDDYLLMFKYANKDCILAISIPREFYSKYNVTGTQRINRKSSSVSVKIQRDYDVNDSEYASDTNSSSTPSEVTPLAPANAPSGLKRNASNKAKYRGKPSRGKGAIEQAHYTCEYDPSHQSFKSEKTGENYMEPHHLIPISNQGLYKKDIDITSNLICLCPTCHKQIHHGKKADVKQMLTQFLTVSRQNDLKTCGIEIDLNTLMAYYDVN